MKIIFNKKKLQLSRVLLIVNSYLKIFREMWKVKSELNFENRLKLPSKCKNRRSLAQIVPKLGQN